MRTLVQVDEDETGTCVGVFPLNPVTGRMAISFLTTARVYFRISLTHDNALELAKQLTAYATGADSKRIAHGTE